MEWKTRGISRAAFYNVRRESGITLLLVIVLLSAILSISVGIFNVIIGEFRISGETSDSFQALYAANQGAERTYYEDYQQNVLCTSPEQTALCTAAQCYCSPQIMTSSGACYVVQVSKISGQTKVESQGQYQCGVNSPRVVRRRVFSVY